MKIGTIALSALAMLASGCVTAISPHEPLPAAARTQLATTDVVVPIGQSEIYIYVPPSQAAMYTGGGLIGALIQAGVDSNNASTAEEAIKPLRNALLDYNFDDNIRGQLQSELSKAQWLNAGNYKIVKEVTTDNLDRLLVASTSSGVLFATTNYNLNWSSDAVTVNITPHLFPKTAELSALVQKPEKSGPKTSSVNAIYRNVLSFRDRAPNVTDVRETNMKIWEANSAAAMRTSLNFGAAKLAELLVTDLNEPLAPIDEKTTKLAKVVIDGVTGYAVKTDDQGTLVQFPTGALMYLTKAALAPLAKGAPEKSKSRR